MIVFMVSMLQNELLIQNVIHPSPLQLTIAVAGGGSGAISELLAVAGASRTILEAIIPYSETSLIEFLSHKPEQFCSEKTARQMAMTAFLRTKKLSQKFDASRDFESISHLIGIGCTCSLASDRPKHGDHRLHLAVQSFCQTLVTSVIFQKGTRSRREEEQLAADLLIVTIAVFAEQSYSENHTASSDVLSKELQKLLRNDEKVQIRSVVAPKIEQEILFGNNIGASFMPNETPRNLSDSFAENIQYEKEPPYFLFPGSFAPFHRGHRRMIEIVYEKFGRDTQIALEIAVRNVDKPSIDYIDIQDRLTSIAQTLPSEKIPVWLTQLPRFTNKAEIFHGATFLVGTDTLKRIALPNYYGGSVSARNKAIDLLTEKQCRFLCFARKNDNGNIETAEALELPEALRHIVIGISPHEFCDDISSTQLRRLNAAKIST
ncbi:MAG: hypothetical protein LBJ67_14820 [Planctomycetaceae bacterium]|jgi:nicotinic acid mononucleotide adenylyltransferase|nr:hypothetical protein [Planctomycetaceae bacterium]